MRIPIPGKDSLYIETGPRWSWDYFILIIGIPIPGNNFILKQGHDIQSINYFIHPLPPTNTTYQYTTHRIKAVWFCNFHTNIQVFIKSSWSIYPSLATWLTPNSWWKVALCLVPESLEVLSVVCPAKCHGWGGLRCHVQQCCAYTPGGPKRGCTAVPVHYAHMAGLLRRPYGAPLQQPVTLVVETQPLAIGTHHWVSLKGIHRPSLTCLNTGHTHIATNPTLKKYLSINLGNTLITTWMV